MERRTSFRVDVMLHALVKGTDRPRLPVKVVDLSTDGCAVFGLPDGMTEGRMWLALPGDSATLDINFQVVRPFTEKQGAGIEFVQPLRPMDEERLSHFVRSVERARLSWQKGDAHRP